MGRATNYRVEIWLDEETDRLMLLLEGAEQPFETSATESGLRESPVPRRFHTRLRDGAVQVWFPDGATLGLLCPEALGPSGLGCERATADSSGI